MYTDYVYSWKFIYRFQHSADNRQNRSARDAFHMSEGFNERYGLNKELAQMLKGGVIMDVTTP